VLDRWICLDLRGPAVYATPGILRTSSVILLWLFPSRQVTSPSRVEGIEDLLDWLPHWIAVQTLGHAYHCVLEELGDVEGRKELPGAGAGDVGDGHRQRWDVPTIVGAIGLLVHCSIDGV